MSQGKYIRKALHETPIPILTLSLRAVDDILRTLPRKHIYRRISIPQPRQGQPWRHAGRDGWLQLCLLCRLRWVILGVWMVWEARCYSGGSSGQIFDRFNHSLSIIIYINIYMTYEHVTARCSRTIISSALSEFNCRAWFWISWPWPSTWDLKWSWTGQLVSGILGVGFLVWMQRWQLVVHFLNG